MKETKNEIIKAVKNLDEEKTCIYLDSTGRIIGRTDMPSMLTFAVVLVDKVQEEYGSMGLNAMKTALDKKEEK